MSKEIFSLSEINYDDLKYVSKKKDKVMLDKNKSLAEPWMFGGTTVLATISLFMILKTIPPFTALNAFPSIILLILTILSVVALLVGFIVELQSNNSNLLEKKLNELENYFGWRPIAGAPHPKERNDIYDRFIPKIETKENNFIVTIEHWVYGKNNLHNDSCQISKTWQLSSTEEIGRTADEDKITIILTEAIDISEQKTLNRKKIFEENKSENHNEVHTNLIANKINASIEIE